MMFRRLFSHAAESNMFLSHFRWLTCLTDRSMRGDREKLATIQRQRAYNFLFIRGRYFKPAICYATSAESQSRRTGLFPVRFADAARNALLPLVWQPPRRRTGGIH